MRYLIYVHECNDIEAEGASLLEIFDHFVKCFMADASPEQMHYNSVVESLAYISNSDDLMPTFMTLLSFLHSHPLRRPEHDEYLSKAQTYATHYRLRNDNRLHPLLQYILRNRHGRQRCLFSSLAKL